jgi:hypothetical protein
MLKESQNSDGFSPYVWIESRKNNESHIMQQGIWGSAQFRVHLIQVPRYMRNKATPVSCSVLAYRAWIHERKGQVNKGLNLLQDHGELQLSSNFSRKRTLYSLSARCDSLDPQRLQKNMADSNENPDRRIFYGTEKLSDYDLYLE